MNKRPHVDERTIPVVSAEEIRGLLALVDPFRSLPQGQGIGPGCSLARTSCLCGAIAEDSQKFRSGKDIVPRKKDGPLWFGGQDSGRALRPLRR